MSAALRAAQFPEDAGPLAHPVRPDSYIGDLELLHRDDLQQGRRGDPDDARRCSGRRRSAPAPTSISTGFDGDGRDLRGFRRVHGGGRRRRPRRSSAAGTARPARRASRAALAHERGDGRATLTLRADACRRRRASPTSSRWCCRCKLKLFGARPAARSATSSWCCSTTPTSEIVFEGVAERAGAVDQPRLFRAGDRRDRPHRRPISPSSSAHDDDPFARYEAMQQLMLDTLVAAVERRPADHAAGDRGGRATRSTTPRSTAPSSPRRCCCRRKASSATRWRWSIPRRSSAAREALRARSRRGARRASGARPMTRARADRFEYSPRGQGRAPAAHGRARLYRGERRATDARGARLRAVRGAPTT